MPILANALIEKLEVDYDRYCDLLQGTQCGYLLKTHTDTFVAYDVKDTAIPGLEDCRLLLVRLKDEIVYSCYYKVVDNPFFGKRVVQVEVRTVSHGLARLVMSQYFLKRFDAIRTDISNTPAGRKMWEKFIGTDQYEFYIAELSIDARTELGRRNQNANSVESILNLRRLTTDDVIWHDNRRGNVSVIYATNASIL